MAALGQTNISTTLVGNTLGISTHNVSQLCTSDKINILSGRKPVKQPYSNVDGVQNWWKAANGNWGIKLPETGSSTALPPIGQPMARWQHDKPTGGPSEPFRLSMIILSLLI